MTINLVTIEDLQVFKDMIERQARTVVELRALVSDLRETITELKTLKLVKTKK